ncbi:MAG TPA: hypothetical protein VMV66_02790 [Candidatus Humimicrobiaceae bacterium]|nr:hypothetical protein [Candidatus Humimicrobiaceae bacterium]
MPKKYTKKEFWKFYEKLPQELKDALFAKETEDNIYSICERNSIMEKHENIIDYVGQVLIGLLPPGEFEESLKKELKLDKETTRKVVREISRFIFYPVKTSLEELYKTEAEPSANSSTLPRAAELLKRTSSKESDPEEKTEEAIEETGKDVYREPLE